MRRTTNRPSTRWLAFLEENAVNGVSATSARDTHTPVASSYTAFVYSMGVHALSPIAAIAARTLGSRRTVTDTSAPPRIAAPIVAAP